MADGGGRPPRLAPHLPPVLDSHSHECPSRRHSLADHALTHCLWVPGIPGTHSYDAASYPQVAPMTQSAMLRGDLIRLRKESGANPRAGRSKTGVVAVQADPDRG